MKVGAVKILYTNLIYSRVIVLQTSGPDIDIKDVLGNEVAPIRKSIFDDTGDIRIVKLKSTLKKTLQFEVLDRVACGANVSVLEAQQCSE